MEVWLADKIVPDFLSSACVFIVVAGLRISPNWKVTGGITEVESLEVTVGETGPICEEGWLEMPHVGACNVVVDFSGLWCSISIMLWYFWETSSLVDWTWWVNSENCSVSLDTCSTRSSWSRKIVSCNSPICVSSCLSSLSCFCKLGPTRLWYRC